jgi:hypothetical protein
MAKYLVANLGNGLFRLRVELTDEVAQFSFMYFENTYKILTYAFFDKGKPLDDTVKWEEISKERAMPVIELGFQKYNVMMSQIM